MRHADAGYEQAKQCARENNSMVANGFKMERIGIMAEYLTLSPRKFGFKMAKKALLSKTAAYVG